MDPSGSPGETMSEVWSRCVCGGGWGGVMGRWGQGGSRWGQAAHWGMELGMEMFLRNWTHGAKQDPKGQLLTPRMRPSRHGKSWAENEDRALQ